MGAGYVAPVMALQTTPQIERRCLDLLDLTIEHIPGDVPVTKLLRRGAAGPAIVHEAKTGEYDVIVMGSRGRGDLRSLFMGSASHHVCRASPVPVLLVHAPAARASARAQVA